MKMKVLLISCCLAVFAICLACGPSGSDDSVLVRPVNPDYFIQESQLKEIKKEMRDIEGVETECFVITVASVPAEHKMGPWCPDSVSDGKDKGGIWFKDGKVYDVSGHFITKLDEFYDDDKWKLYREDGSIKVTKTQVECESAARPDVDEKYHNYCVECLPDFYKERVTTYVLPVTPTFNHRSRRIGRNGLGLAFNGVNFDPAAPVHAIIGAHTLAPLDDHGGHVNPHAGYHYHAATGSTKEIAQEDGHASMIGYALDGFGIFSLVDQEEKRPVDLDECRGHTDEVRGYHYHAGYAGDNEIIGCFHGTPGSMRVSH